MTKTCKTCHFLCYQSNPFFGIGTNSEPWKIFHHEQTKKPRFAIRSWNSEERECGDIKNAVSPMHKGKCFKGIWEANVDTKDEERVAFIEGFQQVSQQKSGENVDDVELTHNFNLHHQINKSRRKCFWTPYQKGQELDSAAEMESRGHLSEQNKRTRTREQEQ